MQASALLIAASASIIFVLGTLHLLFTYRGDRLHPRDPGLTADMKEASPVLTRETTMWRAWIGFNASHSLGALLFGLVFGYLALMHSGFLFGSLFLMGLGLVTLLSYLLMARRYWFSTPFNGIFVATLLYVGGAVMHWV
jgi:hypothetical protein